MDPEMGSTGPNLVECSESEPASISMLSAWDDAILLLVGLGFLDLCLLLVTLGY